MSRRLLSLEISPAYFCSPEKRFQNTSSISWGQSLESVFFRMLYGCDVNIRKRPPCQSNETGSWFSIYCWECKGISAKERRSSGVDWDAARSSQTSSIVEIRLSLAIGFRRLDECNGRHTVRWPYDARCKLRGMIKVSVPVDASLVDEW